MKRSTPLLQFGTAAVCVRHRESGRRVTAALARAAALALLACLIFPAVAHAELDAPPRPRWARLPSKFVVPTKVDANTLWKLANHRDTWVRLFAANAINRVRGMEVIHPATKLAEDDDPYVRAEAVRASAPKTGGLIEAIVIRGSRDRAAVVRLAAAESMGASPKDVWVESLTVLAQDREYGVRVAALRSMARCGTLGAEGLVQLYDERGPTLPEVRTQLRESVVTDGPVFAPLLESTSQESADLLASCGPAGAKRLLDTLDQGPSRATFYAKRALLKRPTEAARLIAARAEDPLDEVSASALAAYIQVLVAAANPDLAMTLAQLARDRRSYVRGEVMRWGRRSGDHGLWPLFLAGLEDPAEEVRKEAIIAVGTVKADPSVPHLLGNIERNEHLLWSIWALGQIADRRAVEPLLPLLEHERATIRQYACVALESIGDNAASHSLAHLVDDEDAVVRYFALRALLKIEN